MEAVPAEEPRAQESEHRWTVFSNHGHILICIAYAPDMRVRDIAKLVGITERATQAILSELVQDGYVERTRVGRRNHYRVRRNAPLRNPVSEPGTVGDVLDALPLPRQGTVGRARHVI